MRTRERVLRTLDITVVAVLFIVGVLAGKLVMERVSDTWIAFNGPALGVIGIGGCFWHRVRKRLAKKQKED